MGRLFVVPPGKRPPSRNPPFLHSDLVDHLRADDVTATRHAGTLLLEADSEAVCACLHLTLRALDDLFYAGARVTLERVVARAAQLGHVSFGAGPSVVQGLHFHAVCDNVVRCLAANGVLLQCGPLVLRRDRSWAAPSLCSLAREPKTRPSASEPQPTPSSKSATHRGPRLPQRRAVGKPHGSAEAKPPLGGAQVSASEASDQQVSAQHVSCQQVSAQGMDAPTAQPAQMCAQQPKMGDRHPPLTDVPVPVPSQQLPVESVHHAAFGERMLEVGAANSPSSSGCSHPTGRYSPPEVGASNKPQSACNPAHTSTSACPPLASDFALPSTTGEQLQRGADLDEDPTHVDGGPAGLATEGDGQPFPETLKLVLQVRSHTTVAGRRDAAEGWVKVKRDPKPGAAAPSSKKPVAGKDVPPRPPTAGAVPAKPLPGPTAHPPKTVAPAKPLPVPGKLLGTGGVGVRSSRLEADPGALKPKGQSLHRQLGATDAGVGKDGDSSRARGEVVRKLSAADIPPSLLFRLGDKQLEFLYPAYQDDPECECFQDEDGSMLTFSEATREWDVDDTCAQLPGGSRVSLRELRNLVPGSRRPQQTDRPQRGGIGGRLLLSGGRRGNRLDGGKTEPKGGGGQCQTNGKQRPAARARGPAKEVQKLAGRALEVEAEADTSSETSESSLPSKASLNVSDTSDSESDVELLAIRRAVNAKLTCGGKPTVGGKSDVVLKQAVGGKPAVARTLDAGGKPVVGGKPIVGAKSAIGGNSEVGGKPAIGGRPAVGGVRGLVGEKLWDMDVSLADVGAGTRLGGLKRWGVEEAAGKEAGGAGGITGGSATTRVDRPIGVRAQGGRNASPLEGARKRPADGRAASGGQAEARGGREVHNVWPSTAGHVSTAPAADPSGAKATVEDPQAKRPRTCDHVAPRSTPPMPEPVPTHVEGSTPAKQSSLVLAEVAVCVGEAASSAKRPPAAQTTHTAELRSAATAKLETLAEVAIVCGRPGGKVLRWTRRRTVEGGTCASVATPGRKGQVAGLNAPRATVDGLQSGVVSGIPRGTVSREDDPTGEPPIIRRTRVGDVASEPEETKTRGVTTSGQKQKGTARRSQGGSPVGLPEGAKMRAAALPGTDRADAVRHTRGGGTVGEPAGTKTRGVALPVVDQDDTVRRTRGRGAVDEPEATKKRGATTPFVERDSTTRLTRGRNVVGEPQGTSTRVGSVSQTEQGGVGRCTRGRGATGEPKGSKMGGVAIPEAGQDDVSTCTCRIGAVGELQVIKAAEATSAAEGDMVWRPRGRLPKRTDTGQQQVAAEGRPGVKERQGSAVGGLNQCFELGGKKDTASSGLEACVAGSPDRSLAGEQGGTARDGQSGTAGGRKKGTALGAANGDALCGQSGTVRKGSIGTAIDGVHGTAVGGSNGTAVGIHKTAVGNKHIGDAGLSRSTRHSRASVPGDNPRGVLSGKITAVVGGNGTAVGSSTVAVADTARRTRSTAEEQVARQGYPSVDKRGGSVAPRNERALCKAPAKVRPETQPTQRRRGAKAAGHIGKPPVVGVENNSDTADTRGSKQSVPCCDAGPGKSPHGGCGGASRSGQRQPDTCKDGNDARLELKAVPVQIQRVAVVGAHGASSLGGKRGARLPEYKGGQEMQRGAFPAKASLKSAAVGEDAETQKRSLDGSTVGAQGAVANDAAKGAPGEDGGVRGSAQWVAAKDTPGGGEFGLSTRAKRVPQVNAALLREAGKWRAVQATVVAPPSAAMGTAKASASLNEQGTRMLLLTPVACAAAPGNAGQATVPHGQGPTPKGSGAIPTGHDTVSQGHGATAGSPTLGAAHTSKLGAVVLLKNGSVLARGTLAVVANGPRATGMAAAVRVEQNMSVVRTPQAAALAVQHRVVPQAKCNQGVVGQQTVAAVGHQGVTVGRNDVTIDSQQCEPAVGHQGVVTVGQQSVAAVSQHGVASLHLRQREHVAGSGGAGKHGSVGTHGTVGRHDGAVAISSVKASRAAGNVAANVTGKSPQGDSRLTKHGAPTSGQSAGCDDQTRQQSGRVGGEAVLGKRARGREATLGEKLRAKARVRAKP